MKIALDPWMIRDRSLTDVCRFVAEIGYQWIELSPRDDFLPLYSAPRANRGSIAELKRGLSDFNLGLASVWTVYRWSEPNDPEAVRTAIAYWKEAIEIAGELGCSHLNSEFSGNPHKPTESEAAFLHSLEEIIPFLEREKITMAIEPHPGDFVEDGTRAVQLIRALGSAHVKYLYCAPHTYHMGGEMVEMIRDASTVLDQVHVADTFDHRQPVRYIVNPPDSTVRVHQHLNIGEGEIDWESFFRALAEIEFDGILTNAVFAWPDRAEESGRVMLRKITEHLKKSKLPIKTKERLTSTGKKCTRPR
jgi:myo-inositol catabolism protein IolH